MHVEARWRLGALLAASLAIGTPQLPAVADVSAGEAVFQLKCAACHAQGGNAINPMKTLKAPALEASGFATQEAIVRLVSNGKGQMPSYGPKAPPFARLTDEQIADVAEYVRAQAADGWTKSAP